MNLPRTNYNANKITNINSQVMCYISHTKCICVLEGMGGERVTTKSSEAATESEMFVKSQES